MVKADFDNFFEIKKQEVTESNAISCSLNLTEENENKIISLSGNVLKGDENEEEQFLVYGGLATFNVVFMADELTRIEVGTKFTFKTKKPTDTCSLKSVSYRLSNVRVKKDGGMLYAEATLTTIITYFEVEEKAYLKSTDALSKCGTMPILTKTGFNASFELEDEFEEKRIKRVLSSDTELVVTRVDCSVGAVKVYGNAVLSVVMLPFLENSDILKEERVIPFEYEVDCDVSNEDSVATAIATLSKLNLKVYQDEEKGTSNITAVINFAVCGTCQQKVEQTFVEDCYSTACDLNLNYYETTDSQILTHRCEQEKVFGKAHGDVPEYSRLAKIIGERAELSDSVVDGEKLTVSGVIVANAVFVGSENEFITSNFSLPFSVDVGLSGDSFENLQLTVEGLTCKLRSGKMEAEATLKICFAECEMLGYKFINALIEGENKAENKATFSVYLGQKGDTAWDVTKHLGLSEEEILKYNENLTFPLNGNEKIMVFRQVSQE